MRKLLAVPLLILLTSCVQTTTTPEANLFTVCKLVSSTETSLRPLVSEMTHEQTLTIAQVLTVSRPICNGRVADVGDPLIAVRIIQAELARLLAVQSEVSQ